MNEHEWKAIKLGLIRILNRPNWPTHEGKQPMQNDAQKHSESPEGI
jgi:hypothetical protein